MVENFTEIQTDAFTEVGDFIMGAAASVISGVAGNETVIDSPAMETVVIDEAKAAVTAPVVAIDIKYNAGFQGNSSFIFQADDMAVLYNLAAGFDASEPGADLENIAESELGDVINQMVNQVVNAMSEIFDRLIVIGPPDVRFIPSLDEADLVPWGAGDDEVLKVDYSFNIDSVFESSLTQIIPMSLAKSMVNILLDVEDDEDVAVDAAETEEGDYTPPPPPPPSGFDEEEQEPDEAPLQEEEMQEEPEDFIIPEEESLADQPPFEDHEAEDLTDLRGPVTGDDDTEAEAPEGELPDFSDELPPDAPDFQEEPEDSPAETPETTRGGEADLGGEGVDISNVSSDDLTLGGGPEIPPAEDDSSALSQDELSKLITGMDGPEGGEGESQSDAGALDDVASLFADATKEKKPEKGEDGEAGSEGDGAGGAVTESEEDVPLSYEESIEKLELIKDIPIELTVVMGENQVLLKELINAGKGSMISLKRYAREPVDIMVNDQIVARGEVVVVDGRIGVRIVSIETRFPQFNYEQAAK